MCIVNDGYIMGVTSARQKRCQVCQERTLCIDITSVELPRGVEGWQTILHKKGDANPISISAIGIGCGCYAKLHRQLAHITDGLKREGRAV